MKLIILLIIILVFLVNNLFFLEKFNTNKNNLELFNNSIVRIRSQKKDFNWMEPYINNIPYESIGTGFFINKQGYLVTNYHVINNSLKIHIQIPIFGSKTFESELISVNPKLDLALLKIKNYKVNENSLNLGNSDNLKRGDDVVAIGYPLGQTKLKMTSGIVSGFQDGDIQTDSAINPGNSGGPLIKGDNVIGVNYAGYDDAQNVSYAIPINYLKNNLEKMKKKKFINFPVLGCTFNNTNKTIMNQRKLCKEGYYISQVLQDGTMDKVGIKKGDILCSFDNLQVDNFGEIFIKKLDIKFHIMDYLKYKHVGDKIDVTIIRENTNEKLNKEIVLDSNNFYKIRYRYPKYENIEYLILGGMVIMNLTNNHLNEDNIGTIVKKYDKVEKKTENKLIITNILKGSSLAEYNIFTAPNILSEVNGKKVTTIKNLKENLLKMKTKDNKEYISFLTENNKYFLLEKEESKKEELFLSKELDYKLSDFIKNLLGI